VVLGYVAGTVTPIWRSNAGTIVIAGALVAVLVRHRAIAAGRVRHQATAALHAGVAVAAAWIGGVVARLAGPAGDAVVPVLWVYEVVLVVVAGGLFAGIQREATAVVTDLVVELGEARGGGLRHGLASVLGDPSLRVGYAQANTGGYLDAHGEPVPIPRSRDHRAATFVARQGLPFAVLVHDRAILSDPALVSAVEAATRLTTANSALHAELRRHVAASIASRRRLLLTADDERRRLEERLHDGTEQRLNRIRDALLGIGPPAGALSDHVRNAEELLDEVVDELHALALGLHPRELQAGLPSALVALAKRNVVPITVCAPVERFPAEIEIAAYYTCAEALSNVTKHAAASTASIQLTRRNRELLIAVSDDGCGGADPAGGTGLTGLADRVEALGGRLRVDSPPSAGTRLTVSLPLD